MNRIPVKISWRMILSASSLIGGIFLMGLFMIIVPVIQDIDSAQKSDIIEDMEMRALILRISLTRIHHVAQEIGRCPYSDGNTTRKPENLQQVVENCRSRLNEAIAFNRDLKGISYFDIRGNLVFQTGVLPPPNLWPDFSVPLEDIVVTAPKSIGVQTFIMAYIPVFTEPEFQTGTGMLIFLLPELNDILSNGNGPAVHIQRAVSLENGNSPPLVLSVPVGETGWELVADETAKTACFGSMHRLRQIMLMVVLMIAMVGLSFFFLMRPVIGKLIIDTDELHHILQQQSNSFSCELSTRKASEDIFRRILETVPDIFWVRERRRILYINPAYRRVTGHDPEALYRNTAAFLDIVDPEDRKQLETEMEAALEYNKIVDMEFRIRRPDQSIRWIHMQTFQTGDDADGNSRTVGWGRDITGIKRHEALLREDETICRTLLEIMPFGAFTADAGGRLLYANPACVEMFGFQDFSQLSDAVLPAGMEMLHTVPAGGKRLMNEFITSGKRHDIFDVQYRRQDHSVFDATLHLCAGDESVKGRCRFHGFIEDVNRRVRAETSLRISEREKAMILDHIADGVIFLNRELRIIWANRVSAETLGFTTAERMIGNKCHEIWYQKDQPCQGCPAARALVTGEFQRTVMNQPDGRILDALARPVTDRNGIVIGVVETVRDITDQRACPAEGLIYGNDEKFRNFLDLAPIGVFQSGFDGEFIYANPALADLFGYGSVAEMLHAVQRTDRLYADPDFRSRMLEEFLASGDPWAQFEVQYHRKNGSFFEASIYLCLRENSRTRRKSLYGFIEDVSERRRAEAALRESEARFRKLFDEMGAGCALHEIICDESGQPVDYRFLAVNPEFERLTGLNRKEVAGRRILEVIPGTEELWIRRYGQVALTGVPIRFTEYAEQLGKHFEVSAYSPAPMQFACVFTDITEQVRASQELRHQKNLVEKLIENMPLGVFAKDVKDDFRYVIWNSRMAALNGHEKKEILGKNDHDFSDMEKADIFRRNDFRVIESRVAMRFEYRSGEKVFHVTKVPVFDSDGQVGVLFGLLEDITEKLCLEEQIRRSQKMEAIGRMAGGIAHDFNNLLQVILGYAEMVAEDISDRGIPSESMNHIINAGRRAMGLIRQLMSYSRQDIISPEHLRLEKLLPNLIDMMKRVIGEHIRILFETTPDIRLVYIDPGQIEQILMNICINARDAMPDGGTIRIGLENAVVDEVRCASSPWASPGDYVCLSVSDTGSGIPAHLRERIFEPFFTTKEVGRGTGLGLFTTFAIVRQYKGLIHVESEPGSGTVFRVYFPASGKDICELPADTDRNSRKDIRGNETVLLAEDDDLVRNMARNILESGGYRVLTARDGQEAVEVFQQHCDRIKLLILDILMPRMNGRDSYEAISRIKKNMPVLFCSGYSDDLLASEYMLGVSGEFVQKPYRPGDFLGKVREILDKTAPCG